MRRWLFADQLGDHFLDDWDGEVLLIESRAVLRRRRFHRAKAHVVLSALRHRATELGDRAVLIQADTYGQALAQAGPVHVVHPTSRSALDFVRRRGIEVLPARGFETTAQEFRTWTAGKPLMERFYRGARRRTGVLMDGAEPAGGRWNYDRENRQPPPARPTLEIAPPWWPDEDEIDDQVRVDLNSVDTAGEDGPRRFAVTPDEARRALEVFLRDRLPTFGQWEDAMLAADSWMSHSLLSVPLNLGLLDPLRVVTAAEWEYRAGRAPLAAVEGFVRQILGWREYMWHLYWSLPEDFRSRNVFGAHEPLPAWWEQLDGSVARCVDVTMAHVRRTGWAHHIQRLMVLGSWALQRGYDPEALTEWFRRMFVDGYDWVMLANVVGMSQYADGGVVATKPYTSGGAYLNRMSDYCSECRFRPGLRTGPRACPFTAGYWDFLARNEAMLADNHRMKQPLAGMRRLSDLDEVREVARRWD